MPVPLPLCARREFAAGTGVAPQDAGSVRREELSNGVGKGVALAPDVFERKLEQRLVRCAAPAVALASSGHIRGCQLRRSARCGSRIRKVWNSSPPPSV
jgi:hypothetical protein